MATMVSLSLLTAAHIILVAVPRSASAADMIEPPKVDELAIPRQQRFDLSKFGGKGDGVTLNTDAFTAAVAAIKAAGGGELYVGKGVWMTTGFALTSHMSLFLEDGATLLGASPNNSRWRPRNESCSSYPKVYPAACRGGPSHTEDRGTGVDERNSGYEPIIGGWNLTDVLITGNNGTIAGQADAWWSGHWKYGRPHAVLFSRCSRVVVSNLTIKDSPFWTVRFWASQQVRASNLTITATRHVFNNDGIDVDSTTDAVIENLYYDGGDDVIALKSGMCEAGRAFNMPTANVRIEHVVARTRDACFCTGSEDAGGTHNVSLTGLSCRDSPKGILLKDQVHKSNLTFTDIKLHNISLYWDGMAKPGTVS
jgi:polygalacturonase